MNVLAGFVPSPEGRAAVERAAAEARHHGGRLHLVSYVANPAGPVDAPDYPEVRREHQAELDQQVEAFRAEGIDCEGHLAAASDGASAAILDLAADIGADLIVIGLRRRSRVGKLVMGSTAQDILMRADCAVLGVKAPRTEET